MDRQAKDFDDFPGDKVSAVAGDGALFIIEQVFWEEINSIATNYRLPIKAIRFIQNLLSGLWWPVDFG